MIVRPCSMIPLLALLLLGACGGAPEPARRACIVTPGPDFTPRDCTQEYAPVCGCDGRTYGNACMARVAGVQRHAPGACGGPPPGVD